MTPRKREYIFLLAPTDKKKYYRKEACIGSSPTWLGPPQTTMVAPWICYRPWGLLGHGTPWRPVRQEAEASFPQGMVDAQRQLLVGWVGLVGQGRRQTHRDAGWHCPWRERGGPGRAARGVSLGAAEALLFFTCHVTAQHTRPKGARIPTALLLQQQRAAPQGPASSIIQNNWDHTCTRSFLGAPRAPRDVNCGVAADVRPSGRLWAPEDRED